MAPASVGKVIPVSAPPRVRAHLRQAADGPVPVLHRGPDAVYVDVAGRCVGVVGPRATAVPCALRSRSDDLSGAGGTAHLRAGVLHLDGVPLGIGRIADPRVPALPDLPARAETDAAPVRPPAPVAAYLGSLGPDLSPADVDRVIGRGDGLTPLGDDVVCGWLAVHRAAGRHTPEVDAAVRAALARTTLLSATLLDCALHGEVLPAFAAYVAAVGTPAEAERAAALAAVGHTSGAGMLYGARLALSALSPTRPHPRGAAA